MGREKVSKRFSVLFERVSSNSSKEQHRLRAQLRPSGRSTRTERCQVESAALPLALLGTIASARRQRSKIGLARRSGSSATSSAARLRFTPIDVFDSCSAKQFLRGAECLAGARLLGLRRDLGPGTRRRGRTNHALKNGLSTTGTERVTTGGRFVLGGGAVESDCLGKSREDTTTSESVKDFPLIGRSQKRINESRESRIFFFPPADPLRPSTLTIFDPAPFRRPRG